MACGAGRTCISPGLSLNNQRLRCFGPAPKSSGDAGKYPGYPGVSYPRFQFPSFRKCDPGAL